MRPVLQKIVHKFLRGAGPHPNPQTARLIIVLRGGRCLVSLPHLNAIVSFACNRPEKDQEHSQETDHHKDKKPENTQAGRNERKRKKTGAGGDLGVGEGGDVRIGVGDRVQLEETQETQGEPQTPRRGVWVSPAPERKRREEETRRRRKQPDKREEGGHIQKPNTGRGLKGLKNHTIYQSQRQKRDTINQ